MGTHLKLTASDGHRLSQYAPRHSVPFPSREAGDIIKLGVQTPRTGTRRRSQLYSFSEPRSRRHHKARGPNPENAAALPTLFLFRAAKPATS